MKMLLGTGPVGRTVAKVLHWCHLLAARALCKCPTLSPWGILSK